MEHLMLAALRRKLLKSSYKWQYMLGFQRHLMVFQQQEKCLMKGIGRRKAQTRSLGIDVSQDVPNASTVFNGAGGH